MDIIDVLEYPLPILNIGIEKLTIEATEDISNTGKTSNQAMIPIKNSGGGTLEGRLISPSACLAFDPPKWEGNRQKIICRFTPDAAEGWKPGDVRDFSALILSNGGESYLPITVRLAKMAIFTPNGTTIANLQDFYAYAKSNPTEAQDIFDESKFEALLKAMAFPYIDAYNLLAKEDNRPRALDNFFILAGLKKRTKLLVEQPEIVHSTLSDSLIHGEFEIKKSDGGYAEISLSTATGADWLTLDIKPEEADTGDADTDDTEADEAKSSPKHFIIKYTIDPLLVSGRYAREQVMVSISDAANTEEPVCVDMIFMRPKPMLTRLSREGYRYQDEGEIIIENQTGEPLKVEVICKESFVRFYEREYKVEESLNIPFIIKLSPLQSAQMLFRKVPALSADIEIKASYKDRILHKTLTLTAGEW